MCRERAGLKSNVTCQILQRDSNIWYPQICSEAVPVTVYLINVNFMHFDWGDSTSTVLYNDLFHLSGRRKDYLNLICLIVLVWWIRNFYLTELPHTSNGSENKIIMRGKKLKLFF